MAEGKQNLQGSAIIAKLFGVTDRRVQQLAKDGVIPAASVRPYKFDLLPTVQAYFALQLLQAWVKLRFHQSATGSSAAAFRHWHIRADRRGFPHPIPRACRALLPSRQISKPK